MEYTQEGTIFLMSCVVLGIFHEQLCLQINVFTFPTFNRCGDFKSVICVYLEVDYIMKIYSTVKSLYLDYTNDHTRFPRKYIWKMKAALKVKIFMWFLYQNTLLTKDNLTRQKWKLYKMLFVIKMKQYIILFIYIPCPLAKMVWHIVYMVFYLRSGNNITNLFENWLMSVAKEDKV